MQSDNLECSICFEAINSAGYSDADASSRKLRCNHTFHKQCLSRWFKYNYTCPLCRKHIAYDRIDGDIDEEKNNYIQQLYVPQLLNADQPAVRPDANPNQIFIPLPFWYSRSSDLCVLRIALQYNARFIHANLASIEDIVPGYVLHDYPNIGNVQQAIQPMVFRNVEENNGYELEDICLEQMYR